MPQRSGKVQFRVAFCNFEGGGIVDYTLGIVSKNNQSSIEGSTFRALDLRLRLRACRFRSLGCADRGLRLTA